MDPRQKIRRAHKYIDRLRVDVLFVAKAFSKGIISKYEHDILNNVDAAQTRTPMDRARYFLSSIEKNINFKNWQIFIELLKGTGQPHLATLFDQGYDEALTGDKVKGKALARVGHLAREIHTEVEIEDVDDLNLYVAVCKQLRRSPWKKVIGPETLRSEVDKHLKGKLTKIPAGEGCRNDENHADSILQAISDIKAVNICLLTPDEKFSYFYPASHLPNHTLLLAQLRDGEEEYVSLRPSYEYQNFNDTLLGTFQEKHIRNFRDDQIGCLTHISKKTTHDLAKSCIQVELTSRPTHVSRLFTDTGPKDEMDKDMMTTVLEESKIFSDYEGRGQVRSVLLQGEAGVGKTFFVKRWCYQWAARLGIDFLQKISLIVVLEAKKMKGTVEEEIKSLFPSNREEMYQYIETHQNSCLIIVEALDEASDEASSLEPLLDGRLLPSVWLLVTARTNQISVKESKFNRVVELKGLSKDKVRDFCEGSLERFLPESQRSNVKQSKVMDAVGDLQHLIPFEILRTPLLCLITCFAYWYGHTAADWAHKGQETISRTLILDSLVKSLVKRHEDLVKQDLAKQHKGPVKLPVEYHDLSSRSAAYVNQLQLLALWTLLDTQHRNITDTTLEQFQLDQDVLKYGFLVRRYTYSYVNEGGTYHFLHEQLLEFMAAKAIMTLTEKERMSIIICLCAMSKLGTLGFLLGLLEEQHEVGFLVSCFVTLKTPNITAEYAEMSGENILSGHLFSKHYEILTAFFHKYMHDLTVKMMAVKPDLRSIISALKGPADEVKQLRCTPPPDILHSFLKNEPWTTILSLIFALDEILSERSDEEKVQMNAYLDLLPVHRKSKEHSRTEVVHLLIAEEKRTFTLVEESMDTCRILCSNTNDVVLGLEGFTESHDQSMPNMRELTISTSVSLTAPSFKGKVKTSKTNTEQAFKSHISYLVQNGLRYLKLHGKHSDILHMLNMLPQRLDDMKLLLQFEEKLTERQWNQVLESLSRLTVQRLEVANPTHMDSIDLGELMQLLFKMGCNLQIKEHLTIAQGYVSAETFMRLLKQNLPFIITLQEVAVTGIDATTLDYVLGSMIRCSLQWHPHLENQLRKTWCSNLVQKPSLTCAISALENNCEIYNGISSRVDQDLGLLYAPSCWTEEEVNRLVDCIFPLFDKMAEASTIDREVRLEVKKGNPKKRLMEKLSERGMKHDESNGFTDGGRQIRIFFEGHRNDDVKEHAGYDVLRRSWDSANSVYILVPKDKMGRIEIEVESQVLGITTENDAEAVDGLEFASSHLASCQSGHGNASHVLQDKIHAITLDLKKGPAFQQKDDAKKRSARRLKREIQNFVLEGLDTLMLDVESIEQVPDIFSESMEGVAVHLHCANQACTTEWNSFLSSLSKARIKSLSVCSAKHVSLSGLIDSLHTAGHKLKVNEEIRLVRGSAPARNLINLHQQAFGYRILVQDADIVGFDSISDLSLLLTEQRAISCSIRPSAEFSRTLTSTNCEEILQESVLTCAMSASRDSCLIYKSFLNSIGNLGSTIYAPSCWSEVDLQNLMDIILPILIMKNQSKQNSTEIRIEVEKGDVTKRFIKKMEDKGIHHEKCPGLTSRGQMIRVFIGSDRREDVPNQPGHYILRRIHDATNGTTQSILAQKDVKGQVQVDEDGTQITVVCASEAGAAVGMDYAASVSLRQGQTSGNEGLAAVQHNVDELRLIMDKTDLEHNAMNCADMRSSKCVLKEKLQYFVETGLTSLFIKVKNIAEVIDILPQDMQEVHVTIAYDDHQPQENIIWSKLFVALGKSSFGSITIFIPVDRDSPCITRLLESLIEHADKLNIKGELTIVHGSAPAEQIVTLLKQTLGYKIVFDQTSVVSLNGITTLEYLLSQRQLITCSLLAEMPFTDTASEERCQACLENCMFTCSVSASKDSCVLYKMLLERVLKRCSPIYAPSCWSEDDVNNFIDSIFPLFEERQKTFHQTFKVCVEIESGSILEHFLQAIKQKGVVGKECSGFTHIGKQIQIHFGGVEQTSGHQIVDSDPLQAATDTPSASRSVLSNIPPETTIGPKSDSDHLQTARETPTASCSVLSTIPTKTTSVLSYDWE